MVDESKIHTMRQWLNYYWPCNYSGSATRSPDGGYIGYEITIPELNARALLDTNGDMLHAIKEYRHLIVIPCKYCGEKFELGYELIKDVSKPGEFVCELCRKVMNDGKKTNPDTD